MFAVMTETHEILAESETWFGASDLQTYWQNRLRRPLTIRPFPTDDGRKSTED